MYVEHEVTELPDAQRSFYVYEAPLRVWHWVNALCVTVLAATGYYISNPVLPALAGEASQNFAVGYVRFAHFATAHVFAVGLLFRTYWAWAGNRHAHQIFFVPAMDGGWWRELWFQVRWYLLLEDAPKRYLGHNPLAQLGMVVLFTIPAYFMVLTGFAIYSEAKGVGSWHDRVFGWVIPLLGQSQQVHSLHHLGMWVIATFTLAHVYVAIREDLMSRQSVLSAMVTGWRDFRD